MFDLRLIYNAFKKLKPTYSPIAEHFLITVGEFDDFAVVLVTARESSPTRFDKSIGVTVVDGSRAESESDEFGLFNFTHL